MHITRAKITSYSSFSDSGWIAFSPDLNIIIGENNSGKSALLSALRPQLVNKPHKNPANYLPGNIVNSRLDIDISCRKYEFLSRVTAANTEFRMPFTGDSVMIRDRAVNFWKTDSELTFSCTRHPGSVLGPRDGRSIKEPDGDAASSVRLEISAGKLVVKKTVTSIEDTMPAVFDSESAPSFYYFSAQRLNVGVSPFADAKLLSPNAANLPNVLAYLQGSRRPLFDEIQERVREIIPTVDAISVTPSGGHQHVLVRSDRLNSAEELAFALDECGTGVAQTISILTAVVTSKSSVIIIDEINSFLHPAAVKRLINLFRTNYNHHQYILSTHSSDVISASEPKHIHVVERVGYESRVRSIESDNLNDLKKAAQSLGISMLDVFGHEYVVWVEGPTEESCFRRLLYHFGNPLPASVAISKVPATGDFARKASTKKAVLRIYKAVADAIAPLTRGMAFALDREGLSDDECEHILRDTDGELRLLPRRCIENYLLHPAAISTVVNAEIGSKLTLETVEVELRKIVSSADFSRGKQRFNNDDWLKRVDGANLLSRLFPIISDGTLEYRKTRHGQLIIDEILRMDDNSLRELFNFVDERVLTALKA